MPEIAVWSGDTVRMDEEGFLYFIGRRDEMIKTSGYRVSPTEVEEVIYGLGMVAEAAAVGVPHRTLGQAIVVIVAPKPGAALDTDALLAQCQRSLPAYMVPHALRVSEGALPRNPNGKIDRKSLGESLQTLFDEAAR
jgi:acyl-coenzyme A synthetase/AMP-(fatty) acid ligase